MHQLCLFCVVWFVSFKFWSLAVNVSLITFQLNTLEVQETVPASTPLTVDKMKEKLASRHAEVTG